MTEYISARVDLVGTLGTPLASANISAAATASVNVILLIVFSVTITFFMAVSRRLRDLSVSIVRGAHARTCETLHINELAVSLRTLEITSRATPDAFDARPRRTNRKTRRKN
jgi:hypothetical protein